MTEKLEKLNSVMTEWDWSLAVFPERYGRGFRAFLVPAVCTGEWFQKTLTGKDTVAVEMQCYLEQEGAWLPSGYGVNALAAIAAIGSKLSALPEEQIRDSSRYQESVRSAYDTLWKAREKFHEPHFIAMAARVGSFPAAPELKGLRDREDV